MRLRYGSLWTKSIGDDKADIEAVMKEWRDVLGNISGDEVKHGLDTWDSEFPPNVYQFRTACKAMRRQGAHKVYKTLPKPEPDKESARESLNAMKTLVEVGSMDAGIPLQAINADHVYFGDTRTLDDLIAISSARSGIEGTK